MLSYSFMQNALFISICISLLCPCIGIYLVLRHYAMMGDTMAHASLAGIACGLLFRANPVLAAFIFTSLAGIFIEWLRQYFKKYTDLILTVVLSLSVGLALTLISTGRLKANVNSFLFGSVLTVTPSDMAVTAALTLLAIAAVYLLYDSLLYLSLDEETAKILGVRVQILNYSFALLTAGAIAISIQVVGILVITSLIALPVACAIQLARSFRSALLLAMGFSFLTMMTGLFGSWYSGTAPGGLTALSAGIILILVILFKKERRAA